MTNRKINRIVITGGGTGGHLIPAFAIADALKNKDKNLDIRFIGSKKGIESKLYKNRDEKYYLINIQGIKRGLTFSNIIQNTFIFPVICLSSIINVIKIYKNFRPEIVIGTGGYSSAIPLFIARLKNIKIIIQEQNAIPGLVNKLFLKKAYKVCFGFNPKETADNFINTGNPTLFQEGLDVQKYGAPYFNQSKSRKKINISDNFTIFILGGSQGSVPINNHFLKNYKIYKQMGIQLIWQCGQNNISKIKSIIDDKAIHLYGFINPSEMPYYYSAANLVISRSGALTLSELAKFNVPSILIPFPYSANNHQLYNAKFFHSKQSAQIVEQNQLKTGLLEKKVKEIISDSKIIDLMKDKIKKIAKPNAAEIIASEILKAC